MRRYQQVQHIIGMPLQLIIIGMAQSFIILFIRAQQLASMSMLMPGIGIILQVMPVAVSAHSIMHIIIGIIMPIIGIIMPLFIMLPFIISMLFMAALLMHIIDMLAHCVIIGMPQFIIICIICALLRNIAMSMPAAGCIVHIMQSSIISHVMVAIIIGMPIIGIIGMLALIGICIAFIMLKSSFKSRVAVAMRGILGIERGATSCRRDGA
ncbi:MAG: hypothetical protein ACRYF9_10395 [Janthinobacterium lividum]